MSIYINGLQKNGYDIQFSIVASLSPADNSNYFFGLNSILATSNLYGIIIPVPGIITDVYGQFTMGVGSNESVTLNLDVSGTTYSISTSLDFSSSPVTFTKTGLNAPVIAGDIVSLKLTTPVWGTNPTNFRMGATAWIQL